MNELNVKGIEVMEFSNIQEFEQFINNAPINSVFRWETLGSSRKDDADWRGTKSYEEAQDLLKHGCEEIAKKLEKQFQLKSKDVGFNKVVRNFYDVVGFQVSVPRYLQGLPTSMVNQKKVVEKARVITINKSMSYNAFYSTEEIIEESAKALALIKAIETKGIRVNLNLCMASDSWGGQKVGLKIRVKNAGERINVSKLSFIMAHPSMLRRMLFRWLEVNPKVTDKGYTNGYGRPIEIEQITSKNEYTIPKEFNLNKVDDVIKTFK
jgi:hypothetical protein